MVTNLFSSKSVISLVISETLKSLNIVASDIVELSPDIDSSGVSSVVAAKVFRSLIMILEK